MQELLFSAATVKYVFDIKRISVIEIILLGSKRYKTKRFCRNKLQD